MPQSKTPERFDAREDPEQMVFIEPGDPIPDIMIRLPNGALVPQSVYGKPPSGLSINEIQAWVAKRSAELMSKGNK